MTDEKRGLQKWPTLDKIVLAAAALAGFAALGWMVGYDNIFDLAKQMLAQAGWIEGATK